MKKQEADIQTKPPRHEVQDVRTSQTSDAGRAALIEHQGKIKETTKLENVLS